MDYRELNAIRQVAEVMKTLFGEMLQLISAGALGLFVGALLAEGFLFVPYWRSLPADVFFSLHKEYGPRIYRFFAPLTILATMLAIVAAVVCFATAQPGHWPTAIAGILSVSMMGIYLIYFKQANAKFAEGRIRADELAAELGRWARWHWVRVIIGVIAFAAALFGLRGF